MQLVENYKKIYTLLAIATVFSTVAPVRIYAQDTVMITNFMGTSQNTGGQSTKGQDGQPGQNGQDGTSGQPGKSGADGVDGKSTASVHIESTTGAEKNGSVYQTQVAVDSSSSLSTASATTGSAVPEIVDSPEQTESARIVESSPSGVQQLLFSLRVMFFKYVSLLF